MGAFAGEFQFPRLERVVSGADTIDALAAELDGRGLSRIVVVTGRTLGASSILTRITRPLGDRCVLVFREARQHVPSCSVADLVEAIDRSRADGVISFGGGSPIDTVKAAIHVLLTRDGAPPLTADGPVHIAVPTTLSAGEFTPVVGVTDEKTRIKRALTDARLSPCTVYTDPAMTLETPGWLWAASGVRALDHAVETIYSARRHPLSQALAERGLSLLLEHLPRSLSTSGAAQLEHRLHCQMGAWMSVFGLINAGFGLSHALGHQIGPRWDVPHGVTSCITLPHAMRFMAERVPARFDSIAAAFGLAFDPAHPGRAAMACADRMDAFISSFDLPRRLRDVQVPAAEIGDVAGVVHDIMSADHVVDRAVTRDEIRSVLDAAY